MPSLKNKKNRTKRLTKKAPKGGAPTNNLPTETLNNRSLPSSEPLSRRTTSSETVLNVNGNPTKTSENSVPGTPNDAGKGPLLTNSKKEGESETSPVTVLGQETSNSKREPLASNEPVESVQNKAVGPVQNKADEPVQNKAVEPVKNKTVESVQNKADEPVKNKTKELNFSFEEFLPAAWKTSSVKVLNKQTV